MDLSGPNSQRKRELHIQTCNDLTTVMWHAFMFVCIPIVCRAVRLSLTYMRLVCLL